MKEIRLYNLYCVRKREKSSIKLLQIDSGNYLKDRPQIEIESDSELVKRNHPSQAGIF